jgi:protein SCO1/2
VKNAALQFRHNQLMSGQRVDLSSGSSAAVSPAVPGRVGAPMWDGRSLEARGIGSWRRPPVWRGLQPAASALVSTLGFWHSRSAGHLAGSLRWILAVALLGTAACSLHSGLPELGDVPAFTLVDARGASFSSAKLQGKIWVADFFFTTCNGPCPRMSAVMHRLQQRFLSQRKSLDRVRLVSISIDPAHDTPAVIAEYSGHFRADSRIWWFLTGDEETVKRLSADTFHVNTRAAPLEHSTRFVLVDGKSRIRGYYETTDVAMLDQLVEDVGALRREVF